MAKRSSRRSSKEAAAPKGAGRVPYKLASYEHDYEGKKFKSSAVVYSFWSAAKYTLVLSIVLWWLPLFGQMIAGYVGGRRAGGPWKGVAAAIVPVACLYIVMTGFDSGALPTHLFGVAVAPAAVSASLSNSLPFISPYIQFSSEYVGSFVEALAGSSPYGINTYVVTVAFAYVGGILAEQSRREIEYNSGATMSNTTVLVADNPHASPQRLHPYPEPAHPGLAHMISAHLPWSSGHHGGSHQHVFSLPPADARGWAQASEASIGQDAEFEDEPVPCEAHLVPVAAEGRTAKKQRSRSKKADPWQRAERRTKHRYSSSRRFSEGYSGQGSGRRQKVQRASSPGYMAADERSVKRARKRVEREWRRRPTPPPLTGRVVDFDDEEDFVHPGSAGRGRGGAQGRSTKPKSRQWDSI